MRRAGVLRLAAFALILGCGPGLGDTPRASAGPDVPPVSDAARAAGFVDVRTVVPDAVLDLRYATTNNFTHTQLYPSDARCLVHQSMAPGLAAAAGALRPQGHLLVFWDCYRPPPTSRSRCSAWSPTRPGWHDLANMRAAMSRDARST